MINQTEHTRTYDGMMMIFTIRQQRTHTHINNPVNSVQVVTGPEGALFDPFSSSKLQLCICVCVCVFFYLPFNASSDETREA